MFPRMCPICQHNALEYDFDKVRCDACKAYVRPLKWYLKPYLWACDKSWWWRAPILLWILYIFYRYVRDYDYPMQRIANIFNAMDFGIHELGHFIFLPLGEFMTILGGSLFQVIFPVLWLVALYWKRWYFAASICFIWIGLNLFDVATYVADARARILPLATMSSDYDSAHDWYQILSRMNRLDQDLLIASRLRIIGVICAIIGTILSLSLLVAMLIYKKKDPSMSSELANNKTKPEEKPLYPTPTRNL